MRTITGPLLVCSAVLLGCAGGDSEERNTFATNSNGDGDTETGDGDPSGDGDGDPSGDGDGDPSGDGDGDPSGDGDGDPSGDGDGDADCNRRRWSYNLVSGVWTSVALDQAWVGPNAPPCSVEILAATHIDAWSELIVVGLDEQIYRRVDGVWQAPQSWADSFAALADGLPTAALHTPSLDDPARVDLVFALSGGSAVIYDYSDQGGIVLTDVVELTDGQPPAAPQASEDVRWAFVLADTAAAPDPEWLVWTMNYTDNFLYRYNAAFEWVQAPQADNEYFSGGPDEPDPSAVEAAYADQSNDRVYFVGPG